MLRIAALALVYALTGKLGLLAAIPPGATAIWPPTGISLAALLLLGYRVWPGVALGSLLVNQTTATAPLTAVVVAIGNTAEALVGAYLVNRLANGSRALDHLETVLKFGGVALFAPLISATIGVGALLLGGGAPWSEAGTIWVTWWRGDAAGALVVGPLVLLWCVRPRISWSQTGPETTALMLALALVGQAGFHILPLPPNQDYPVGFLSLPILTWAAVRLTPRTAVTAAVAFGGIALAGTLQGAGPLGRAPRPESLLLLQSFAGTISITTLVVATALADQRKDAADLRRSAAQLAGAEERARRRIVELLHGRVQNRLLVTWHTLGEAQRLWTADPSTAQLRLGEAREIIDQVREHDVREASHLLYPAMTRVGLIPALQSLVGNFEGELAVRLDVDPAIVALDNPGENRIQEEVRLTVYRVAEEALGNVLRHAQASSVAIRVRAVRGGSLEMTILDDGCGFDAGEMARGFGLSSVAAHVDQAGGRWEIASHPGRGTTLSVRLPLTLSDGA